MLHHSSARAPLIAPTPWFAIRLRRAGVFSRAALAAGADRVVAVEPEPSNAQLWQANCAAATRAGAATLVQAAVAHGAPAAGGTARLVVAPPRSDGVANTWRHALEGLSHYASAEASDSEAGIVSVETMPLFGPDGLLETHRPSFVKLDCEGAELELLAHLPKDGSATGGFPPCVQRLVVEWSFTKPAGRDMRRFAHVVACLEAAGFEVWHEGCGGHWQAAFDRWPWHSDAVLYAARRETRE